MSTEQEFIVLALGAEDLAFTVKAASEHLARLAVAKALAETGCGGTPESWRVELLDRSMWKCLKTAYLVPVP